MTTRSLCISAAVLLLAMTLTWPAFPGQSNTESAQEKSPSSVAKKTDKSSPVVMRNRD